MFQTVVNEDTCSLPSKLPPPPHFGPAFVLALICPSFCALDIASRRDDFVRESHNRPASAQFQMHRCRRWPLQRYAMYSTLPVIEV